jgi:hypothetical protein
MRKKRSKSTHLYILSCGDKIKIGITNDIDQRLMSLKTGNPLPITLEFLEERTNPHKAEHYVLNQLSKYRIKGTEWFVGIDVNKVRSCLFMFHDQEP